MAGSFHCKYRVAIFFQAFCDKADVNSQLQGLLPPGDTFTFLFEMEFPEEACNDGQSYSDGSQYPTVKCIGAGVWEQPDDSCTRKRSKILVQHLAVSD